VLNRVEEVSILDDLAGIVKKLRPTYPSVWKSLQKSTDFM